MAESVFPEQMHADVVCVASTTVILKKSNARYSENGSVFTL